MFQDVTILNGPVKRDDNVVDLETMRVKARPLGRPYVWDDGRLTNGGFLIIYECDDKTVYIQEIEWEAPFFPSPTSSPRTCYYYERYASLDEVRASGRGWLIEYALGNE